MTRVKCHVPFERACFACWADRCADLERRLEVRHECNAWQKGWVGMTALEEDFEVVYAIGWEAICRMQKAERERDERFKCGTTHHHGCDCHEATRNALLDVTRENNERLRAENARLAGELQEAKEKALQGWAHAGQVQKERVPSPSGAARGRG